MHHEQMHSLSMKEKRVILFKDLDFLFIVPAISMREGDERDRFALETALSNSCTPEAAWVSFRAPLVAASAGVVCHSMECPDGAAALDEKQFVLTELRVQ